jgi:phage antirepressor YoqD-like protein
MASIVGDKPVEQAKVQEKAVGPKKRFVDTQVPLAQVLKWNEDGDELIFLHETDKFLEIDQMDLNKLNRENKIRYSVSRELNLNERGFRDPDLARVKVTQANERRKQFEQVVKGTSQSARATKKLQAFVGEGFEPFWARADKIEDRLASGYEIVKPAADTYAGVSATEGHYETRVKQGETELVLMRVSKERKAELAAAKAEAARRLDMAGEKSGASELRGMGASLISENQGGVWQDRA